MRETEADNGVVVIGAGFAGLAAAYDLAKAGVPVTVLESDDCVGGLAGSFVVGDTRLEKFYHHWFTSDTAVLGLIDELGLRSQVVLRPSRTGMYYANTTFRLSTPLDVMRFSPLSWGGRIRLGLLVLRARAVKDWRALEDVTAHEWLRGLCGEEVFRVVWEPLLRGKFGPYADEVSAVWFWNKLKLRGGSRGRDGSEVLAYFRGGFAALAERVSERIVSMGGVIRTRCPVRDLVVQDGVVRGVRTDGEVIPAAAVVATPALPIVADLVSGHVQPPVAEALRRIEYLANVCLVFELDRSLSYIYWLNVNDPDFPFVGIIEHTNFEPPVTYGGRHLVYLSKYLPPDAELYRMEPAEVFRFAIPHVRRMFPDFDPSWVKRYHVWKARYAQPVVVRRYGELIPPVKGPLQGLWVCSMAQIYPEDRGTNYAVREGRRVAAELTRRLRPPDADSRAMRT